MNIHEAVVGQSLYLSTVIARRPQAVAGRRRTEIFMRQQAPAQLNAVWTPPMSAVQLKLFYFISWWNHAWN